MGIPARRNHTTSLTVWMTLSVAVFVLLGSLALGLVFERHLNREERRAFENLARANAGFLERTPLPQSAKMAAQLGELIGAEVYFWHPSTGEVVGSGSDMPDAAVFESGVDGEVRTLPNGKWMVSFPGRDGTKVVFFRPATAGVLAVGSTDTWLALAGFWVLSFALGCGLARRVTRPLEGLVKSLPLVGTEQVLSDLPVGRGDEIGILAQTLISTHESLGKERERRRAAERHALLGRMATSLAHEVRNPVSAIRLHAQLLDQADPSEAAVSRAMIEGEAERIEGLVGQWLSYAKPAPPVLTDVDVGAALVQAIRLMEPQARHAGVVIEAGGMEGGPAMVIPADRHRIQQVFVNLLRNAIQAMPSGGLVRVHAEDSGLRVKVVFEDEGGGFSESALSRLAEPFYSEKEGGMGLGLAVAKDICEAHGGKLLVENRDGAGACVQVEFEKATSCRERS